MALSSFKRHASTCIGIILLLTCSGCPTGPRNMEGRLPKAPVEAPPPPPARTVPLDAELAAAADRELTQARQATDPILRVHALEAIRESSADRHGQDILHALKDPEPRVRFAAALAAGELRMEQAHARLLELTDDASENVRVAVRFALHRIGDKHLSHDLERMAIDSNPLVRGNTALVLGLLGEPSALPILHVLRVDPNPAVRQNASEAMWRLGDEDGMQDLVGMTVSRYPDDRMIGLLALAWPRNTRVRQHLRACLVIEKDAKGEEIWPEVVLVAARAMGMMGSDEGYVMAQKGAASTDSRQRVLAALAFGAIGRPDAQDILRKLLADRDPDVRIAAATAILQLKPGAAKPPG